MNQPPGADPPTQANSAAEGAPGESGEVAPATKMKNAIVFSVASARWAIELRWVREVITLGHTTPVPNAPAAFAGVVNFGGAIVPVLELMPLIDPHFGRDKISGPRASAILLQVESVRAALRVDAVVEVTTLRHLRGEIWTDTTGLEARLLDPQDLVARARAQVSGAPLVRGGEGPTR